MPEIEAVPIVGTVVDTVSGLVGGNEADESVQNASQQASDTQLKMYNQMREDLSRYRTGGENLWSQYQNALQGGSMTPDQTSVMNALKSYVLNQGGLSGTSAPSFSFSGIEDPSLQFVQDEALKATERSAAARTGVLGGAAQKALQKNAGNIASTYWQNAYQNALNKYGADITGYNSKQNAYQNQAQLLNNLFNTGQNVQQNYLQQLLSGAQLGANAATATGSAGLNTGNALANNSLLSGLSSANNAANTWSTVGQGANNVLSSIPNLLKNTTRTTSYDPALGEWVSGSSMYSSH